MGNTGSGSKRDRAYSTDTDTPSSPGKDDRAFEFTTGSSSRKSRFIYQASLDDSDDIPSFRKGGDSEMRPRASTMEGGGGEQPKATLPTVFKWEGGGKDVCISGTFTNWKPIPMVHSHGDFVVILDVPEGDHQYKFMVDGTVGSRPERADRGQRHGHQEQPHQRQTVRLRSVRGARHGQCGLGHPERVRIASRRLRPGVAAGQAVRESDRTARAAAAPSAGHPQQGHAAALRTDAVARTQPRHAEPPVRLVHQGRRHGTQCHAQVPEEIRHHATVQANLKRDPLAPSAASFLSVT
ncbi:hypothetical protein MRX96_041124 [Rhipicephalus microplus]